MKKIIKSLVVLVLSILGLHTLAEKVFISQKSMTIQPTSETELAGGNLITGGHGGGGQSKS